MNLYGMDLLWLMAKVNYNGLKQPSEVYYGRQHIEDNRSGKEIAEDVLNGMGGE